MNFHGYEPLTTEFLLVLGDQEKLCPSYYGKDEDKKKVKMVLQQEIHPEVSAKWGNLTCHCQKLPKMWLSKLPKISTKCFLPMVIPLKTLVASIFNGSIHHCIHCLLIPFQTGCEKPTNQDPSNPSLNKIESGCSKQSKM